MSLAPALLLAAGLIVPISQAQAEPGRYAECPGRIVRTVDGKEIPFSEIAPQLAKADFVLFGERHGVREQAQASACVLSAMAIAERPTTLVMEMLSVSDQKTIDAWRKEHPETAAGLGAKLRWWERGWPAFETWLPLIERAFSLRLRLFGGDLPQKAGTDLSVGAREEKAMARRLGGDATKIFSGWETAMSAAHCGLVSEKDARQLGLQQVRRDLSIADTALAARGKTGAVLLHLGRGHARKDRSIHAVLSGKAAGSIISIGAFAAEEEIKAADRQVHDYLWIVGSDTQAGKPCAFTGGTGEQAGETSQ